MLKFFSSFVVSLVGAAQSYVLPSDYLRPTSHAVYYNSTDTAGAESVWGIWTNTGGTVFYRPTHTKAANFTGSSRRFGFIGVEVTPFLNTTSVAMMTGAPVSVSSSSSARTRRTKTVVVTASDSTSTVLHSVATPASVNSTAGLVKGLRPLTSVSIPIPSANTTLGSTSSLLPNSTTSLQPPSSSIFTITSSTTTTTPQPTATPPMEAPSLGTDGSVSEGGSKLQTNEIIMVVLVVVVVVGCVGIACWFGRKGCLRHYRRERKQRDEETAAEEGGRS